MTQPVFEITKAATFDAAHHFPNEPEGSPYRRIHGHSFQVEVSIRSDRLDANGWVADLNALDTALQAAAGELDLWFARRLTPDWPGLSRVVVSRPTIHERCALDL